MKTINIMKLENGIDYGDLIFSKRFEIDQKAYAKYYYEHFTDDLTLTYNSWYGTKLHKRYATPLLRKMKLEKINHFYDL